MFVSFRFSEVFGPCLCAFGICTWYAWWKGRCSRLVERGSCCVKIIVLWCLRTFWCYSCHMVTQRTSLVSQMKYWLLQYSLLLLASFCGLCCLHFALTLLFYCTLPEFNSHTPSSSPLPFIYTLFPYLRIVVFADYIRFIIIIFLFPFGICSFPKHWFYHVCFELSNGIFRFITSLTILNSHTHLHAIVVINCGGVIGCFHILIMNYSLQMSMLICYQTMTLGFM